MVDDSIGIYYIFYPSRITLVVWGFFRDGLLSEVHVVSNFILSSLKKFFGSSILADNGEMLRCKTDKSSCFTFILFSSSGV